MTPTRLAALAVPAALTLVLAGVLAGGCASSESSGTTCPPDRALCGTVCVDLQSNTNYCGDCATRCAAGATCQAGQCQCPSGQPDVCGPTPGQCTDLQGDAFHCGDCATSCGVGTCAGGTCDCTGLTSCPTPDGSQCADLASDTSNCGACRTACAANESCVDEDANGLGACTCVGPQKKVCPSGGGQACIDVFSNEANCGDCGVVCGSTFTCVSGVCTCSGATPDGCPAGSPTFCTNLSTDRENCRGCGNRCPVGGSCGGTGCECPAGSKACGAPPGTCVNTSGDRNNCGDCGITCSAAQSCVSGACACSGGLQACGTACCRGTDCCPGGGCQVVHSNGLGGSYFSCDPLQTYTLDAAKAAALSWEPGGLDGSATAAATCGLGCFGWQTAHSCATWCYAGNPFVGKVFLVQSLVCACAGTPSNWD